MSKGMVAIIGAGMGGLAAARYLKSQGFSVSIFECHDDLGGQWNRHSDNSGVWPQMRTNTAKFVTKLSDVHFPEHVHMFPRNGEVLDMINEFASMHGLRDDCRFGVTVTGLRQITDGYVILCVARPVTDITLEIGVDSHDRLYRNPFLDPLKPHELKADIAAPKEA